METFLHDLRYGLRILLRNPAFAAAAVVCLALGIGATTAIFSVVNAVLLRPLPYVQPQRLVKVYSEFGSFPGGGLRRFWISPPEYLDLKRETKSWESLAACGNRWALRAAPAGLSLLRTTIPGRRPLWISLTANGSASSAARMTLLGK